MHMHPLLVAFKCIYQMDVTNVFSLRSDFSFSRKCHGMLCIHICHLSSKEITKLPLSWLGSASMCAFNPSTWDSEASMSLSTQCQPVLQRKFWPISKKNDICQKRVGLCLSDALFLLCSCPSSASVNVPQRFGEMIYENSLWKPPGLQNKPKWQKWADRGSTLRWSEKVCGETMLGLQWALREYFY